MSAFLQQFAQDFNAKHAPAGWHSILILMPNQRSCTYLRQYFTELSDHAVILPEITPLQEWYLQFCPLVEADETELLHTLYECYCKTGGELALDDFIPIASTLLDDYSEIDESLTDHTLFFKNVEMLQSMKTYEPGSVPTEYQLQYRKFWKDFGQWHTLLKETLLATNKGYKGLMLRTVAENFSAQLEIIHKRYTAVYALGFSGVLPADERVLTTLKREANAVFYTDADVYYLDNPQQEAGAFYRKHPKLYSGLRDKAANTLLTSEKKIEFIGVAKNMGQVKVATGILHNLFTDTENIPRQTAVILPDTSLLIPFIKSLPASVQSYNVSMGLPLQGTHSFSWFENIFRLYENHLKYTRKPTRIYFYYRDVLELLQHKFFTCLLPEVRTHEIVRSIKKNNQFVIGYEQLNEWTQGQLATFFTADTDAKLFHATILAHSRHLQRTLAQKADEGDSLLLAELEVLCKLEDAIAKTTTLFSGGYTVQTKSLIQLWRSSFNKLKVPLEGEPVEGLQITGLQETRSIDFKNIIVLSANEGILPGGKSQQSYIPHEIRNVFLTTYKDKEAVTSYLFYRMLQRAENVYLLYNTEPDEMGGGEMSRFLLQLQKELAPLNKQIKITSHLYSADPPPPFEEPEIIVPKTDAIQEQIHKLTTESGLSPSAINTYINCTLQYYFRYIAGLNPADEVEESMDAATIGSAVHYALEKLLEPHLHQPLTADVLQDLRKQDAEIDALVHHSLLESFSAYSLSSGKNVLLKKVCIKLTKDFLKQQAEWIAANSNAPLTVLQLESKLETTLQVGHQTVKIQGRIDRIDRYGDAIRIADYKTSTHKSVPALNEETYRQLATNPAFAKTVQLLLYAYLYHKQPTYNNEVLQPGIYWLKHYKKDIDILKTDAQGNAVTTEHLQRFETILYELISGLLDSRVPFVKTNETERCKYCDYAQICSRG